MEFSTRWLRAAAAVALVVAAPVAVQAAGVLDLMRSLPDKETVTEADAVKAAAVLVGERQHATDVAACETRLRERGILDAGDSYTAARKCNKGFASMLFARGMGLKGGWAARLTGKMGPRLAYKELAFLDIVPPMGERDLLTGGELLAMLKLSQDYVRGEQLQKQGKKDYYKRQDERYGHGR